ncbi:outer membrane protein assembly factor BamD [Acidihalobacter prosperus]
MQIWRHVALITIASVALAGCATTKHSETKNWTAQQYYKAGTLALKDGDYSRARTMFQDLRGHYPFGRLARQAQLDTIYVYYKQNEPKSAVQAAQSFIKQNPLSPDVPYAYYLEGLANFNAHRSLMTRIFPIPSSKLDVKPLKESFTAFKTLVKKYPHSAYAPDARKRMIYLRNELARHELYVAHFYMRRGAYVAVVNRCKVVLQQYPGASDTPRALKMMIKAYKKLGMPELASQTREVLNLNYPQGKTKH